MNTQCLGWQFYPRLQEKLPWESSTIKALQLLPIEKIYFSTKSFASDIEWKREAFLGNFLSVVTRKPALNNLMPIETICRFPMLLAVLASIVTTTRGPWFMEECVLDFCLPYSSHTPPWVGRAASWLSRGRVERELPENQEKMHRRNLNSYSFWRFFYWIKG